MQTYQHKPEDLLEHTLPPKEEEEMPQTMYVYLTLVMMRYLLQAFFVVSDLYAAFTCVDCHSQVTRNLFSLLTLVWAPLACYKTFRKQTWGWILLFGMSMYNVISAVASLIPLWTYGFATTQSGVFFVLNGILDTALVIYLWRSHVAEVFDVGSKIKYRTVLAAIGGSILLSVLIALSSYWEYLPAQ